MNTSNGSSDAERSDERSKSDAFATLLDIPTLWIFALSLVALLTALSLQYDESGGFSLALDVGVVTLAAVALVWLPSVLRLFALGGRFKWRDIEAEFRGLAGSDSLTGDVLNTLNAVRRDGSLPQATKEKVDDTIGRLEEALTSTLAASEEDRKSTARQRLKRLSRKYESTRSRMESSDDRTYAMERIVSEMKVYAAEADLDVPQLRTWFDRRPGERIAVLAVLQRLPMPEVFDIVLEGIGNSRSAFEQYHALRAAQEVLGQLSSEQKQELKRVIEHERSGVQGTYINDQDSDRWNLSEDLLNRLTSGDESE